MHEVLILSMWGTSMRLWTAIFTTQMKNMRFSAQNIEFGHSLTGTNILCFVAEIRKVISTLVKSNK